MSFNDFVGAWLPGSPLKSRPGQQATVIEGLLHTVDHPLNMPVLVMPSNRANFKVNPVLPLKLVLQTPQVKLHVLQATLYGLGLVNEELLGHPNLTAQPGHARDDGISQHPL